MFRRLKDSVSKGILGIAPASNMVGTHNQTNRDLWLKAALLKVPAGSRILDAGAGELKYKPYCSHLNYVSQDFAQYDGKGDGIGLQMGSWDQTRLDIVSDITTIPEPDASFDAAMCIEVLEHVPYPVEALRELARLLKPGGYLIVTAPFCSMTHFAPYFYQTGYSRYFYEYWLAEFNFNIIDLQFNGNYFEYLAQELRRLPRAAKDYANTELTRKDSIATQVLLASLDRLSRADLGSKQFLSFGLHIFAQKQAEDRRSSSGKPAH